MSRRFWRSADIAPPLEQPEHRKPRDLGGGGGNTTTIQKSDPWVGVQPYLTDLFSRSGALSRTGGSPYLQQASQMQAQQALDPNSLVSQGQRELGRTISGQYLTVDGNPAIQAAIDAARRTVSSQFSGDNYGSSANQEWLARGAASAAAPLLAQERQNQLAAISAAPGIQQANIQQLYQAGEEPWRNLQRYQGLISGQGGGTTSTSEPYFTNPVGSALGGALGGHALGQALGFAGPYGALIGAGLGLLGGRR